VSPVISLIQSITESKSFMTDASLVEKQRTKCPAQDEANQMPMYKTDILQCLVPSVVTHPMWQVFQEAKQCLHGGDRMTWVGDQLVFLVLKSLVEPRGA
jgi:hypothetical protein